MNTAITSRTSWCILACARCETASVKGFGRWLKQVEAKLQQLDRLARERRTPEELKAQQDARARIADLQKKYQDMLAREYRPLNRAADGETPEAGQARKQKLLQVRKKLQRLQAQTRTARQDLEKLMGPDRSKLSPDEQKARLEERLANPEKYWKYNPGDLDERALWAAYREAYEIVLERTSTQVAPWHVIPSDKKWYRNLAIAQLLLDTLRGLDLQWPAADFDVEAEKQRLAEETPVQ